MGVYPKILRDCMTSISLALFPSIPFWETSSFFLAFYMVLNIMKFSTSPSRCATPVKDFVNNGCMFLLVISHFLIHVVTHASVHMTHDEGRKFLEPTCSHKVFYYYDQRVATCNFLIMNSTWNFMALSKPTTTMCLNLKP